MAGPQIGPTWEQALDLPGAAHCTVTGRFLRANGWHDLRPAPERARSAARETSRERQPACAVVPGERWVVYLPAGPADAVLLGLTPDDWQARWLDPRTGAEHDIGRVSAPSDGIWPAPARPSADDWVLVLSRE
jgi:hypothetical protein